MLFFDNSQFKPFKSIYQKLSKVDANSIKKYAAERSFDVNAQRNASHIDSLKIYQSILSKRLPSGIANGMTNLMFVTMIANATTEHVENAVVKWN